MRLMIICKDGSKIYGYPVESNRYDVVLSNVLEIHKGKQYRHTKVSILRSEISKQIAYQLFY